MAGPFTIQRANVPRGTPIATQPAAVDTGEGRLIAAVGQAGQALVGFGEVLGNIEVRIEKAKQDVEFTGLTQTHQELENDGINLGKIAITEEELAGIHDGVRSKQSELKSENERVNQAFTIWRNQNTAASNQRLKVQELAKRKEFVDIAADINLGKALESGDFSRAKAQLQSKLEIGTLTKAQFDERVSQLGDDIFFASMPRRIDADPAGALEVLEKFTPTTNRGVKIKNSLVSAATTAVNRQKSQKRAETQQRHEVTANQLFQMFYDPKASSVTYDTALNAAIQVRPDGTTAITSTMHKQLVALGRKGQPLRSDFGAIRSSRIASYQLGAGTLKLFEAQEVVLASTLRMTDKDAQQAWAALASKFSTAQSNAMKDAVDRGRTLVNQKFIGIQVQVRSRRGQNEADRKAAILENKTRIAQFQNREFYDIAMAEWLEKNPEADTVDIRKHSLQILPQFHKNALLPAGELEAINLLALQQATGEVKIPESAPEVPLTTKEKRRRDLLSEQQRRAVE